MFISTIAYAACDDTDSDCICNDIDNCPDTWNSEQLDADTDGTGDLCDNDPGCGGCGQPACEESLTSKVEELLTHYYLNILNRAPDSGGLNYWTDVIISLVSSGGDIKEGFISFAQSFFNSQEYLDRGRDDEEFVTDLYNTFFDREPGSGGFEFWTNQLSQGMSRNAVLDHFVCSEEFNDFMNEFFSISSDNNSEPVFLDFNSPGQLDSDFNQIDLPNQKLTEFPGEGVQDSVAVSKISAHTGKSYATYTQVSYDFSQPDSHLQLSIMLKFDKIFTDGQAAALYLGLTNDNYNSVTGNTNNPEAAGMSVEMRVSSDSSIENEVDFTGWLSSGNSGSGGPAFGRDTFSVIPSNWYLFSVDFQRTESSFIMSVSVDDFGPTGEFIDEPVFNSSYGPWNLSTSTQISSFEALSNDDEVWAGFVLLGHWELGYVDNLSVTPIF